MVNSAENEKCDSLAFRIFVPGNGCKQVNQFNWEIAHKLTISESGT